MGYACPVCGTPQADGEHLADHVAFTAMLHGGEHETWLDEHVPGWEEGGPGDLRPRLVEHADEVEYPAVFEDTTGDHDHGHADATPPVDPRALGDDGSMDAETRRIVERAREFTERMRGDDNTE